MSSPIDTLLEGLKANKDPQIASGHIKQLLIRTGGPTGEKTRKELAEKGGVSVLLGIAKSVPSLAASSLLVLNKVSRNPETKNNFIQGFCFVFCFFVFCFLFFVFCFLFFVFCFLFFVLFFVFCFLFCFVLFCFVLFSLFLLVIFFLFLRFNLYFLKVILDI